MSFRLKIILGVAAIQAVFLSMMIWNGLSVLRSSNEESLLRRINITTSLFASMVQPSVLSMDMATLDSFVKELLKKPGIVYARVRSNQSVMADEGDKTLFSQKFEADTDLASTETDGVFDAYAEITVSGTKYGQVEIGFSTTSIQQLIYDTGNQTLRRALISMVLVALFSWILGHYLTRGLNFLQQGTKKIAGFTGCLSN